nr:31 kDa ribonucleoprotein, chloroplastic-like [Aegilops tauschii subsp. strangulata]
MAAAPDLRRPAQLHSSLHLAHRRPSQSPPGGKPSATPAGARPARRTRVPRDHHAHSPHLDAPPPATPRCPHRSTAHTSSAPIIYDGETGQSCGYGFVTMSSVQEFHHSDLDGRPMTVNRAAATSGARAEERPSPCRLVSSSFKLYVSNLPWEVDGPMLKQLFSGYGQVVAAKVLYHGRGSQRRSRGFGFVTMGTPEASQDAIWYLDKQVRKGRKLRVRVAREEGTR